jgi:chromosomal replication initiation ATPase DnaA
MKNISEHIKQLTPYEYELLNTICDHSDIKMRDLLSQKRYGKLMNARKIACLMLKRKGYIYKNIGEVICYVPKDHSTIIYRVRRAKSHYDLEPDFRDMVDKVSNSLMEYKTKISLARV